MASIASSYASSLATPLATLPRAVAPSPAHKTFACVGSAKFRGLKYAPSSNRIFKGISWSSSHPKSRTFKVSCSSAEVETLEIVQSMIAKQLSIDATKVTPETKFVDLGADSLDTVEIMMALEEQFQVSIGESGAENIVTVQDAADLVEKVKAASA